MAKAIIMAGGRGERFWPLTHENFPKYRIPFYGKKSLLQKTYQRLRRVYGSKDIYVITTRHHARMIRRELPGIPRSNILIEPFRKNTAAAIYLSCVLIAKKFGEKEIVSFFPADHLIQKEKFFKKTLQSAMRLAQEKEFLVTVGIPPTFPATGYGYVETGEPIRGFADGFRVKHFVEKPDLKKAKTYLKKKNFFWNGGIFTWRIGVFLRAMKKYSPEYADTLNLSRLRNSYQKLPGLSIDYALMEKAENLALCRASMDWCDLGSWDMFFEKSKAETDGCHSQGLLARKETRDSLLVNHTRTPLVVLGVSGLIVVQTPRGTLICKRSRSEEAALLFKKL